MNIAFGVSFVFYYFLSFLIDAKNVQKNLGFCELTTAPYENYGNCVSTSCL